MRILFFSKTCDFCLKLIEYLDKNNLNDFFKKICIDDTVNIPKNISVVPTIIDDEIEAPLEGKKAFEYVINQKYFNHPTNNVEFIKNGVPKPVIEEDKKAVNSKTSGFIYVDNDASNERDSKSYFDKVFNMNTLTKPQTVIPQQQQEEQRPPLSNNAKTDALIRLRGLRR
jgi:hypothetical protein